VRDRLRTTRTSYSTCGSYCGSSGTVAASSNCGLCSQAWTLSLRVKPTVVAHPNIGPPVTVGVGDLDEEEGELRPTFKLPLPAS
jgi:hypothetical protein